MAQTTEMSQLVLEETGAGAMSETLTHATKDIEIKAVELHLSAAAATASEPFTITRSHATLSAYNTLLYGPDMNGESDDVTTGDDAGYFIEAGQSIVFAFANANTNTWALTVTYTLIPTGKVE